MTTDTPTGTANEVGRAATLAENAPVEGPAGTANEVGRAATLAEHAPAVAPSGHAAVGGDRRR